MRAQFGVALALVIGLASAGCRGPLLGPGEEQLAGARLLWRDLAIMDYSMLVTRTLTNAGPVAVQVTVVGGTVSERRYAFDGQMVGADSLLYPDVDGLFALADDGFRNAQGAQVGFDPTYGFPNRVIINYDISRTDDDVDISVTDFAEAQP